MSADLVISVQEFFKVVPGLLLFPLTLYLAWKKIGTSVTYYPTIRVDGNGMHFSSIVLVNNKDKPIVIKGIVAVCQKIRYDIETFDAPLVIKAYESALVKPSPCSFYSLHGQELTSPFMPFDDLELHLELFDDYCMCVSGFRKSAFWRRRVRAKFVAEKSTIRHNGKAYNPYKVAYIVDFIVGSELRTAFIGHGGGISDSEGLEHNYISPNHLRSVASAQGELRRQNPGVEIRVAAPPGAYPRPKVDKSALE